MVDAIKLEGATESPQATEESPKAKTKAKAKAAA
jgi:hypothetical protein